MIELLAGLSFDQDNITRIQNQTAFGWMDNAPIAVKLPSELL